MLTLLMIRHAKSDWNADYSSDHERPLNSRGRSSAKRMGRFLSALKLTPDSIVTSSAVRARTTVELAAKSAGWAVPIRIADSLYGASPQTVIEEIRSEPNTTRTLLIAGHEPTWSRTCSLLIGGGRLRYPTAALACIAFEAEKWRKINTGRLIWFIPPRLLESCDL